MRSAFTLLELLFGLAVFAVLVAIAIPATSGVTRYAARVKSLSNLRQIGVASRLYANDHQQELPAGAETPANPPLDRWPTLFCAYLTPSDPRVFLDPTDAAAAKLPLDQVLSNDRNNTGYIYNGFDEFAANGTLPAGVPLTSLDHPANTILMSQKTPSVKDFYVNLLTKPISALLDLLNPTAFDGGSHYLFVDGSVRYLKESEYSSRMWLIDRSLDVPGLPPLPGLPGLRPPCAP